MRLPGFLFPLPQQEVAIRYSVGGASAIVAVLLRALLEPVLGHAGFYVTVYVAVVFSALVGGLGPSILSAVAGTAGVVYWFVDPRHSLALIDKSELHGLIGCVLVCPVLIALGEANRSKRLELNKAHNDLELRVKERTAELSRALAELESEINVRKSAEDRLRKLSVHVMAIQDQERRRIARELHDSAGQTLAAIRMTLAMLAGKTSEPQCLALLGDVDQLTNHLLREIRTTSYLLHPPLLDESGFCSAARWFVDGFTKRCGLEVRCDIPEQTERLPDSIELALFRVLQESLTNVHRHSGATSAVVKFLRDENGVCLHVSDNGKGVPEARLKQFRESGSGMGVGISGMRERVGELGGQLLLSSDRAGMTVGVILTQQAIKRLEKRGNASAA